MDFLVLAPPVCTPAEPPSGAFLLAAGLAGHGYETGLLDLSLEFFHRVLNDSKIPGPSPVQSMRYLLDTREGYEPLRHRSATGVLHKKLNGFAKRFPGWKLTLMDISHPNRVHDPVAISSQMTQESPFTDLWEEVLNPVLVRLKPRKVLVSLAYLSQLAAAIDLVRFLEKRGVSAVVGGSLPTSLASTGHGIEILGRVFKCIETGDGMSLIAKATEAHMLDRLGWPAIISKKPYLSARPIVPLTLSTGCFWSRCLFCPDRCLDFVSVPERAIERFFSKMPEEISTRRPIIHLLDSAIPPGQLRRFLPLAKENDVGFYGFARPTTGLLEQGLLEQAAASGLLMLQLGVESGSAGLLERFHKGFAPSEAEKVMRRAADLGVRNYLYLLFGLPGESDSDRCATLDFVSKNADSVDFLNLSLFNLPRYCELTERAGEFGVEIGDFPDDGSIRLYWPFTCNGESPRDEARRFLSESFNTEPRIREALLRTPRWFRAAHLALMKLDERKGP
ncbi:MAG: radical SAM protein [Deltaproteobacteria bacterium]|nr:radical SAM protein [Deltaproteobacteria bacterium]